MIKFFKTVGEETNIIANCELVNLDGYQSGCWIHLVNPSEDEIKQVCSSLNLENEFIKPALDEEERPRIETENGNTMILVDIPIVEIDGNRNIYSTIPLGVVLTKECIVTVCLKENPIVNDFINKRVKSFYTQYKSRFLLQLLFKNATFYLYYLRHIERISNKIENDLQRSMKKKELTQLLKLEKSLVYFSTSLKSNEVVLEKLMKLDVIKKYPEDTELLEDVIIENRQAMEMTNIYSSILSGTMDAFASIISNNLNIVMKSLTIVTIAISIPTAVSSFFGMNVPNFLENNPMALPFILGGSVVLSALATFLLMRRKIF